MAITQEILFAGTLGGILLVLWGTSMADTLGIYLEDTIGPSLAYTLEGIFDMSGSICDRHSGGQ